MHQIDWDLIVKVLTLIVVATGAWIGITEFRLTQKWKRAEFFANEYKKFIGDPYVQKTFIMLDRYSIFIPVNKNEVDGKSEYVDYTPQLLMEALDIKDESTRPKDEAYVRLCIDRFLFKLGIFQSYYKDKLITKEQLETYFHYWIKAIGDENDPTIDLITKKTLYKFINQYDYRGVKSLLATFGYCIPPEKF